MNNNSMQASALPNADAYLTEEVVSVHDLPVQYLRARRIAEILLILITLPFLFVLICFIILLMLIKGRGDIFFIQKRPGLHGKVFKLYKFCTMRQVAGNNNLTGENDSRITNVGRFLRKYKLDEIPQLLNVLKGDMSLIGPRPVPLQYYHLYLEKIPGYDLRHAIRPGITGLAQVAYKYTTTIEEEQVKLQYDLKYIQSISFITDIRILLRTFFNLKSSR